MLERFAIVGPAAGLAAWRVEDERAVPDDATVEGPAVGAAFSAATCSSVLGAMAVCLLPGWGQVGMLTVRRVACCLCDLFVRDLAGRGKAAGEVSVSVRRRLPCSPTDTTTTMADFVVNPGGPSPNEDTAYAQQYLLIGELFDQDNVDWPTLDRHLDEALVDPGLPRYYRAKYSVLRAITADDPDYYIAAAKEGVQSIRNLRAVELRVAEQREPERFTAATRPTSQAEIDAEVKPLENLIKLIESNIVDVDDDDDAAAKIHPHTYVLLSVSRRSNVANDTLPSLSALPLLPLLPLLSPPPSEKAKASARPTSRTEPQPLVANKAAPRTNTDQSKATSATDDPPSLRRSRGRQREAMALLEEGDNDDREDVDKEDMDFAAHE